MHGERCEVARRWDGTSCREQRARSPCSFFSPLVFFCSPVRPQSPSSPVKLRLCYEIDLKAKCPLVRRGTCPAPLRPPCTPPPGSALLASGDNVACYVSILPRVDRFRRSRRVVHGRALFRTADERDIAGWFDVSQFRR